MSNSVYNFRKEDFIPIRGALSYFKRSFPSSSERDSPEKMRKAILGGIGFAIIVTYNHFLYDVLSEGLERLVK